MINICFNKNPQLLHDISSFSFNFHPLYSNFLLRGTVEFENGADEMVGSKVVVMLVDEALEGETTVVVSAGLSTVTVSIICVQIDSPADDNPPFVAVGCVGCTTSVGTAAPVVVEDGNTSTSLLRVSSPITLPGKLRLLVCTPSLGAGTVTVAVTTTGAAGTLVATSAAFPHSFLWTWHFSLSNPGPPIFTQFLNCSPQAAWQAEGKLGKS